MDQPRPYELSDEFVAVPIEPAPAAVRLCVVVRTQPDAVAGWFVPLRAEVDTRVVLGCLADAGGTVQRWLELWVQDVDGLAQTPLARRGRLDNRLLDERWDRRLEAMRQLDGAGVLATLTEGAPAGPVLIDVEARRLATDAAAGWRLCQDDARLRQADLPAYGESLHRYLYRPDEPDAPLLGASSGAPTSPQTAPLETLLAEGRLVPLVLAGRLAVRTFHPADYEGLLRCLSGQARDEALCSQLPAPLAARMAQAPSAAQAELFLSAEGLAGRLPEVLLLKLGLLAELLESLRTHTALTGGPLLNLSPESFRVEWTQPPAALPSLWHARAVLVEPGQAIRLTVPGTDAAIFAAPDHAGPNVYRPPVAGLGVRGKAGLRIRQVSDDQAGQVVLDGTLAAQERIEPARQDLVWLRLALAGTRVDLYATLESHSALAAGEWRFRTLPLRLEADQVAALRSAEGVPLSAVPFELMVRLGSPCDLYSAGVLAVRTLLVDADTTLPKALDELLSLARELAQRRDPSVPPAQRVAGLLWQEPRFQDSLGPHRLVDEAVEPARALALLPQAIWCETLAIVARMFPGLGPDSYCPDWAGPASALQQVYEAPLAQLRALTRRLRSLVIVDNPGNREMQAVLRRQLELLVRPAEVRG